jgi:hypothetical protein
MGRRNQGTTLFTAVLALVGVGVVVQLWLLAAALEALLSAHVEALAPAAVASLIILALNTVLLRFVFLLDRRIRRSSGPPE